MKTYIGIAGRDVYQVIVEQPGVQPYVLPMCLDIANHSPTGFCWGYLGSGPAQLALAILVDHTGDVEKAKRWYQYFKDQIIARFSMKADWLMTEDHVRQWLEVTIAEHNGGKHGREC